MSVAVETTPIGSRDVNLANWRVAPFSKWAFQHVRDLIPTADIAHAPGQIWRLEVAPRSLAAFRAPTLEGERVDLEAFLTATATDALVILSEGKIVYEYYADRATAHTPHIIMSATKAVMGLLVGILARAGAIELDALVSSYVPEVANGPNAGATLRHLTDMRTGVFLEEAEQGAYDAATGWEPTTGDAQSPSLHGFLSLLEGSGRPHGGPFAYYSANTDLLGWALERATGKSCAAMLSELLWQPLGAEADAYITTDGKGAARCTGGLCATARDFARIGQLLVGHGRRSEREIVPASCIDDIAQGGDRQAWRDGAWGELFAPISRNMSYRSGWYTIDDEPQTLFATGIHGQQLFVDRRNQLVVAKVSCWPDPTGMPPFVLTQFAFREIRRILTEGAR